MSFSMFLKSHNASHFISCIVCVTIGGIIRILYCWKYPIPVRDAYDYEMFLRQWYSTGIIPQTVFYPPLGLYLMKIPVSWGYMDIMKGGICVNMILGLCLIITFIQIARSLNDSLLLMYCVGLISATHPALIEFSCHMLRENSYLFFCSISVLFVILFLKQRMVPYLMITSTCLSAAFLCRTEAIELLFYTIIIYLINSQENIKKRLKDVLFTILISVVSFIVILSLIDVPLNYYSKSLGYLNRTVVYQWLN